MRVLKIEKYKSVEPMLYSCSVDDSVPPGARFGPVVRDAYVVECNISGYGSAIINGVEYPVGPGDCYILLPGDRVVHTADSKLPRRGLYCTVGGMRFGQVLSEVGITSESPYAPREAFDEIRRILSEMIAMKGDTDRGAELRRTACIYELLGALTKNRPITDSALWVQKAMGIFETEYHRHLSVAEVASAIGFERSYFTVKFKERVGVSPHRYLTSLRVGKAQTLLLDGDSSVGEVAESVGLDPVNFSRLFKKETGESPLEYRKRHKNRERS